MRERYSWVRGAVTLSDTVKDIQRWQVPFFEQPASRSSQRESAEMDALAQARGFQIGKQEGLDSGRDEAKKLVNHLRALAEAMEQPFHGLDQVVTRELARTAMLIAKKIIRRELSLNSELVTQVAAEAMATLSSLEGDIEISLNPADKALLLDMAPASLEGKAWKLLENPEILPGGCTVKTPISFVDASVEKQMDMIFDGLIESCANSLDN